MEFSIRNNIPSISLIIPTFNRESVLCETVKLLISQDYPKFKIIIVDQTNEHLPITNKFLHDLSSNGKIQYLKVENPSLPNARNLGVIQASGEIVLFVDDDVIPDPEFIRQHALFYDDEHVGGVAGRRFLREKQEDQSPVGVLDENGKMISNFSSDIPCEVEWASGCNMSFRRELIYKAGFFDPQFLGTSVYEDVDFSFRLRAMGYKIFYNPKASLIHLQSSSGGCNNRKRDYKYYYSIIHNSLLFFMKHYPAFEYRTL